MTNAPQPRPKRPGLIPGLASVTAMLVLWAVASQLTGRPQTLPAPWDVAARIGALAGSGELWFNAGMTLMRVGLSFALAMTAGMALGLIMGRSRARPLPQPTAARPYSVHRVSALAIAS